MTVVNSIVKTIKKAPKTIKKGVKKLLKTPLLLLSGLRNLWGILASVGSRLTVLPLDSVSGKLLAAGEVLFVANLLLGAGYGFGRLRGRDTLVATIETVVVYPLAALVVLVVAFLLAYPLDRLGLIEAALVESGLHQYNRLSTGPVAALVGFLTAVVATFLVANLLFRPSAGLGSLFVSFAGLRTPLRPELDFWESALVFGIAFVATAALVYHTITDVTRRGTRTDLSIVEVDDREDQQILRIRNDSEGTIDLSAARIRDSVGDDYTLERDLDLRPGETETLALPDEFVLEPTRLEVPAGLDVIYDDRRVASIYSLSGETFLLEWGQDADAE